MTEKKLSLLQDHCFLCIGSLRILNENKSYSGLLKESIQKYIVTKTQEYVQIIMYNLKEIIDGGIKMFMTCFNGQEC